MYKKEHFIKLLIFVRTAVAEWTKICPNPDYLAWQKYLQNTFSVKITIWGSVIINMGQKIVG